MDRECSSSSEQSSYFLMSMCYRHFGRQRHTRAGCQNLSQENGLTLENADDLTCCHQSYHGKAGFLDRLLPSLFAVDQSQNSYDGTSCRAYGIDSPESGATSC